LYENFMVGVFEMCLDGRLLSANPAMVDTLGCTSELDACALASKVGIVSAADRDRMARLLHDSGSIRNCEVQIVRKNGKSLTVVLNAYDSGQRHQGERILHGTLLDISERKNLEAKLRRLAQIDPLTGLANRYHFNESLTSALARSRRTGTSVGVLFLDLDRFKDINDTLGHHAGDQLLKTVSQRLQASFRAGDLVARLGGDEFAVLIELPAAPADLGRIAEKIVEELRPPVQLAETRIDVSCSVGIAVAPYAGDTAEALMKAADVAMYRAKAKGRDTYRFYSHELQEGVVSELALKRRLRRAVRRQQFELSYQPKVCVSTGAVVELEALLRWNDPETGEPVSPAVFVPLLEQTDDIGEVGLWVLREATRQLRRWQTVLGDDELGICVNISARQLLSPTIVRDIEAAVRESGIKPGCLEIEITETAMMTDVDKAVSALRKVAKMGVRIAIDDFGTGFSSLKYLKLLPVNTLKIDRLFVKGVPENPEDVAIARATAAMGQSLGLGVTAEGVETQEQADIIAEFGCDSAQGFLYSRPLHGDAVVEFLQSHRARGDSE
ncbi:MAG: EAL domain-containing protein, partial [Pseudomonadota bacterium]